jgi:hypothetical protein
MYNKAMFKFYETAKRVAFHSYLLDLCLYFPAPVLAGAALLIADRAFCDKPFEDWANGREYLRSALGIESFVDTPEILSFDSPATQSAGQALDRACPNLQFLLLPRWQ